MGDELSTPKRDDLREWAELVMKQAEESPANSLERRDPKKAACILWHRSIGDSYKSIRNKYGVGLATIKRMEIGYAEPLKEKRKEMSVDWLGLADSARQAAFEKFERLQDNPELLDDISPDRLTLTAAMAQDKAMVLEGQASSIVEHRSGNGIEDAMEAIKQAKARVAEKKVIDIESEEA